MFKNFQAIFIGLVGSFLFLTPFIIFFNSYNLSHLTNEELKLLLYFNLLIILLAIIVSYVLRLFLSINFNLQNLKFSDLFLFLGLFYYIHFFYGNIQIFLTNFILHKSRYLAESIILLIFVLIIYHYIKFKNFKKFILIFISIYLFSNLILFTNKNFDSISIDRFYSHNNIIVKNSKNIDNSNLNIKNKIGNIYFIIFDGMISLNSANQLFKFDKNDFEKFIKKYPYKIIKNSISNYDRTFLSLNTIFSQEYSINQSNKLPKSMDDFFPRMSKSNNIPKLIKHLKLNGYNINWFGNIESDCPISDFINCGYKTKKFAKKFYLLRKGKNISNFFDTHFIGEFFKLYLKSSYKKYTISAADILKMNFLDDIKYFKFFKNKNNFNFIHTHIPHPPNNFQGDCDAIYENWNNGHKDWTKDELNDYKEGYLCAIKKIKELIKYIELKDPKSVVIIQADHGWKFSHMKIKPNERLKYAKNILNIIKSPNNCINQEDKAKSNINTSIYISKCLLNENLQYKENNFFYLPIETSNIKFIKFLEND